MKLVPMRFCGFQWRHNPKEISFECSNRINENNALGGQAYIQNNGRKNMIIKGSGELYGTDCLKQFDSLLALFKQGRTGVLAIDGLSSFYAVFEEIKFLCRPKPDVIEYSFVFREASEKTVRTPQKTYTAQAGECLWDISYKYGISIDKLVKLNPEVKRPDLDLGMTEVVLC